jgi:demethylmenaquinone methyltransferase/2-methoxy-6-polyprenyl-1,4-benzoquinol methylase
MTDEQQTHFGFRRVSTSEKTRLVSDVFKRVAGSYDLMNDLMSLGVHRLWKQELITLMRPRSHVHLLDVAGGTGDIALRFLEASHAVNAENAHVTVCDRNPAMVMEGRNKAIDKGIVHSLDWMVGDATALPFPDNSFDMYSIAFGLRNVTEPSHALAEAYRVLKPGGMFYCLEFSKVTHPLLQKIYKFHAFSVIPRIGSLIAQDREAYQYLVESIEQFPDAESLQSMVAQAGFTQTSYHRLNFGVVAIHMGMKGKD